MTRVLRFIPLALILSLVTLVALFGGAGITVYAANSSLPGDVLYPLKTTIETTRVNLTDDSAAQADLQLEFAGRRLLEIQTLIQQGRYDDLPKAAGGFMSNLQQALNVTHALSQTDPVRASALNEDISSALKSYSDLLTQELAVVSRGSQPVDRNSGNFLTDDNGDDDGNEPLSTTTPIAPATSTPNDLLAVTSTTAPTSMPVIISTSTPAVPMASSVVEGADATCTGFIGAVTVNNLEVPQGASCTLDGTIVQGNIKVQNNATLTAQRIRVDGNIQAEGASYVEVLAGSSVGGSIQLKQGGSARMEDVSVNGDIQIKSNNGTFSILRNWVSGNIQVFQNSGAASIASNMVNGNLQCKENSPAPTGGNNVVQGNKEDQCSSL